MRFPFFRRSNPLPTGGQLIKSAVVTPAHTAVLRDINRRMARMYEAAITTQLNSDFPVSITSANAEILTSIIAARSRARRLERDNPYAQQILTAYQNNVVGDQPFRLEMKVGKWNADGTFVEETETNRAIEQWWAEAGLPENCTVRRDISRLELYLQAITAIVRDGAILLRHYRNFPKNKFGYAVDIIEADRLDHNFNRPAKGSNREIQFSIELDEFQGAVGYWLLSRHPGDVFAWSNSPKYREFVPAEDIIAFFSLRTRAGQYVGMPRFSTLIQRLHRIDQYDIAEITAAIWASAKPFFLTRETPTSQEYAGDQASHTGEKIAISEPATGEILPDGYKPVLVDPNHPTEAYGAFTQQNLRATSAGSGIAYHVLANDFQGFSFSAARAAELPMRDEMRKFQQHMILNFVRPHFNAALGAAIIAGAIPVDMSRYDELVKAARFHARRWPYVNPLQDVQADVLSIEAGLDSRQRVITESDRGGDFVEVCSEQASDNDVAEAHGLDFSGSDPTKPTIPIGQPGEMQPNPEGNAPPTPPKKVGSKQTLKKSRRLIGEQLSRTLTTLALPER